MAALNGRAGAAAPARQKDGEQPAWRVRHDRPIYAATLWPHRALDGRGHRLVLLIAAAGMAVPIIALASTPVVLGVLPFALGTLWMLRLALRRNMREGRLVEEVRIWRDEMRVERCEPDGRTLRWCADPREVRIALHPEAKVEQYLTLRGGGREIELGAFLSPGERVALAAELEAALTRAARA